MVRLVKQNKISKLLSNTSTPDNWDTAEGVIKNELNKSNIAILKKACKELRAAPILPMDKFPEKEMLKYFRIIDLLFMSANE